MKILTILGARPQFIKAAMVSREIAKYDDIQEIILHTGQHWQDNMSDVFFREMRIPKPLYNLSINNLNHGAMTGKMLEGIEAVVLGEVPQIVLVYGDTNSTIAGALAAKKQYLKVAHVEAGLRSFNMRMPEEINRILTDRISDLLFCPTSIAVSNLKSEGFDNINCKIIKSGDVMQDAAEFYGALSDNKSTIIADMALTEQPFVLCTVHRQENTDNLQNLRSIIAGIDRINQEVKVVMPLHPRTQKILESNSIDISAQIIDPVGYFDMIALIKNSSLVITDSGGLQKEAFFFKKHCVTIREETEWAELVDYKFNKLAGSDSDRIYQAYESSINQYSDFDVDLYGNGNARTPIVKELLKST